MMQEKTYHCLIAGLPDLEIGGRMWTNVKAFRDQLEQELHPDDMELVRLVALRIDNQNLARYLAGESFEENTAANHTLEDFKTQEEQFDAILPEADVLPSYMVKVMQETRSEDGDADRVELERKLADAYYEHVEDEGNDFLKVFNRFEYNMANMLTYLEAGNHAMDPWKFISGSTVFTEHLREDNSLTMAASAGFDLFNEVVCYAELSSVRDKEMKYEEIRWRFIEEQVFFDTFTVDTILAYLLRLMILERWSQLTGKAGEEKLRMMVRRAREASRNQMKDLIQQ
jgi:hypothetical protein